MPWKENFKLAIKLNPNMLKEERHQKILNEVLLRNRILINDIAEQLDVSVDTVRRDVKELDKKQLLKKVHGGAISLGFTSNKNLVEVYDINEKQLIARKAVDLIVDGSAIFIDGGTTCMELAKAIPNNKRITCFTLSLHIAMELAHKEGVDLIFIGGKVSKVSHMSISAGAINELSQITFDQSFIGTGYIDVLHGLSEFNWEVVQIKRAIIKSSKKTTLLCVSKKFNSQQKYKCVNVNAITTIVTELDPKDKLFEPFKPLNIKLI